MSELLVPRRTAPDDDGALVGITPERAGWRYVGFEVFRLRRGQHLRRREDARECCAVLLGGHCEVTLDGESGRGVGGRTSAFEGRPHAIYVPPALAWEVVATSDALELAVGTAPATRGAEPRVLAPEHVRVEVRGSGDTRRTIHHILMEDQAAESLLVTEVLTPAGHWSSYPPHKHDTESETESHLEETYYHRVARRGGFAVQRVYTADRSLDETVAVGDGDLVLVPRGYHAVSAAPGYDLYYLNVMAGPRRAWRVTYDPDHAWLA